MRYEQILKELAQKENVSVEEIENEMELAISFSGLKCSPKDLITILTKTVKKDYI